jgi:hypothetical protein
VYEEVCDSVAFSKVKQCIRHQLVRALCPRTTRTPKRNSVIPPFKRYQEGLPWPVESTSPTNISSSLSPQSPVYISGTLVHPTDKPHHPRKRMSENRCCAIQAVMLHQQHLQSIPAKATTDSELQSRVFDENLTEIFSRKIRHQIHVASNAAESTLERPPRQTCNDRDVILQLVMQQERALLKHAMATRRNKESPLKVELCSPANQRVLPSKLVMLKALRAQELGSRCLQWCSDGGTFHYRSSPVVSSFF